MFQTYFVGLFIFENFFKHLVPSDVALAFKEIKHRSSAKRPSQTVQQNSSLSMGQCMINTFSFVSCRYGPYCMVAYLIPAWTRVRWNRFFRCWLCCRFNCRFCCWFRCCFGGCQKDTIETQQILLLFFCKKVNL